MEHPLYENLQTQTPLSSNLQTDTLINRIEDYVKNHPMAGSSAAQGHGDFPLTFKAKPEDGKIPHDGGLSMSLPGGDVLEFHGDKQTLDTTDGSHLTVDHGGWQLKDDKGKEVTELPQLTRELRNPPWSDLSNGGKVVYGFDGKTTLEYHGNKVELDNSGLKSVTKNDSVELLR